MTAATTRSRSVTVASLPILALLLLGLACSGAAVSLGDSVHGLHEAGAAGASRAEYQAALAEIDFDEVAKDLVTLFRSEHPEWPADYGHFGPFFVRLAWHCSGSYRTSDGRGGCAGGRQRFDPERSWDDNTNLDKARRLLWPIKEKYGLGLSWGDLFIFAGTTAIADMNGPILGFCAGRVDADDGSDSIQLGPSEEQKEYAPCPVNGECTLPLGSTTIGLIYLNPEGPMGKPDADTSASQVRDTFGRMAMDDEETVALIGGGHTFGKTHGACPKGAGPPPNVDPINPWPGLCGSGKGADAYTSGFEGPWTAAPTQWDNFYFKALAGNQYGVHIGPGGKHQWKPIKAVTKTEAPGPQGGEQEIMMLTTDVSLTRDDKYAAIVERFAANQSAFDTAFAAAWYKLTTRDMGPVTRCVGKDVPPAQPFQYPLPPPPPPSKLPDFTSVAQDIRTKVLASGQADIGPFLIRLAWSCASTYRSTDYLGGCNGARIRFAPEKDWPVNAGLDEALALLEPVKVAFEDTLSWADLIALAGTVALEAAGAPKLKFCGGRTDARDGLASEYLEPLLTGSLNDTLINFRETVKGSGLSLGEYVALLGGHSLGRMHPTRTGFSGSWTTNAKTLSNEYFKNILNEKWGPYVVPSSGKSQFKAADKPVFALQTDLMLLADDDAQAIAQKYVEDSALWLTTFGQAWTKLLNADRFDGPTGSLCT